MKRVSRIRKLLPLALLGMASNALFIGEASAITACNLPNGTRMYGLTSDNSLYLFTSDPNSNAGFSTGGFSRLGRVNNISGNLIGIDARPSDGNPATAVYGVTNTGNVYRISLNPLNLNSPVLVSRITPRFAAGFQALADFNPLGAQNPLRLIGSNDQNFALVNSAGTLDLTVQQTRVAYAAGDLNAGADPNLTAGAYDNNVAGATVTTFYGIDYDLNTLVTIADRTATGSSNTGGGQLKTIGPLTDSSGTQRFVFGPNSGMDIFTLPVSGGNPVQTMLIVNDHQLYCTEYKNTINPDLPPGSAAQNVPLYPVFLDGSEALVPPKSTAVTGSLIDVAAVSAYAKPPGGYTISGKVIYPDGTGRGVCVNQQVTLQTSNGGTLTTNSNSNGIYTFTGLTNGKVYTVLPPASAAIPTVIDGASVAGIDFVNIACSNHVTL